MAMPILIYDSESWFRSQNETNKIQASKMKFLTIKGCSRKDKIRNEDIKKELNIYNIGEKIRKYETKW